LIVPTVSGADQAWIEGTAKQVRTELVAKGMELWSLDGAALRFEQKGSAPAAEVSQSDIQQWVDRSTKAIRNLAEGDYTTALKQLNKAQALSRSAAEELNREQKRAERVLDTCLYMVRVLLETGSESKARTLVQECRQLVPRVEPTMHMHPPVVLEMLVEVDTKRAQHPRELRVDSQPPGCTVRVNGMMLGETPFEMRDLLAGEYGVQVECDPGRRGRVHVANLTEGSADVFVDLRFDHAIETQPMLHLQYSDEPSREQYREADLERIAKVVPPGAFVVLSMPTAEILQLELVDVEPPQLRAIARIIAGPDGPSHGDVALASRALIDGHCTDFTASEPVALPCDREAISSVEAPAAADGWPARRTPRGQFIAGLTLASFGSAALITGYVLLLPRAQVAEDWVNEVNSGARQDASTQQKWLNMGTAIVLTSSVGAAALVAAMPLALPKREKTPWPAWLSGGLGLGLAAFAVGFGLTAEAEPATSCSAFAIDSADALTCVRRGERVTGAILAGVTAAPLLTVPLVYLLRPKGVNVEPTVQVSRSEAYFGVRGLF
jgi:hypothetical protein